MARVTIVINNHVVDTTAALKIVLDKVVSDFNNPLKKTGQYSYPIKLPWTANNKRIFNNEDDKQKIGKFRGVYSAQVFVDDVKALDGEFVHTRNSNACEGFLSGSKEGKLSDLIGEGTIRDITTFSPVEFRGDMSLQNYLGKDLHYVPSYMGSPNKSEIAFTLVPTSLWKLANLRYYSSLVDAAGGSPLNIFGKARKTYGAGYEDFGLSHFAGAVLENIFRDAGYKLEGSILQQEDFKRLLILFSNNDANELPWNYGTLNPFTGAHKKRPAVEVTTGAQANQILQIEGIDGLTNMAGENDVSKLICFTPAFTVTSGDLSHSIKRPESRQDGRGVHTYTPKYTGEYTVDFQATFKYWWTFFPSTLQEGGFPFMPEKRYGIVTKDAEVAVPSQADNIKVFAAFREITESEFLPIADTEDHFSSSIVKADENTLLFTTVPSDADGLRSFRLQGTVRMERGKQYRLQIYGGHIGAANFSNLFEFIPNGDGNFSKITACDGPAEISVAKFLPSIKKVDYVNAMFKLFNLFYQVDVESKIITIFTRDEFFALHRDNIVDISGNCDIDEFEEEPFDADMVGSAYLQYTGDDNDYGMVRVPSGQTQNYLQKVNGEAPAKTDTVPFAPLTFHQIEWKDQNGITSTDAFPFILTKDEEKSENIGTVFYDGNFNYAPRLALYWGTYYKDFTGTNPVSTAMPRVRFVRSEAGNDPNAYTNNPMPKLTFFGPASQPLYKYDVTNLLQEVTPAVPSTHFTSDPAQQATMNANGIDISSAMSSVASRRYGNTLKAISQGHFLEGECKMNNLLFNKLTGRNLLRIESDLYLLDSINKYDLLKGKCTLKIYKLIQ